jgi:hypothetical protein
LQAGKSNLIIETLSADDGSVVQLCQQYDSDPSLAWGGLRLSWDGTVDSNPKKQMGSTMLVAVRHPDQEQEGLLLQDRKDLNSKTLTGRYILAEDEVLTLITESEGFYAEERFWYLMPNLRLRTSMVQRKDGFNQAAFCSEIRMMTQSK